MIVHRDFPGKDKTKSPDNARCHESEKRLRDRCYGTLAGSRYCRYHCHYLGKTRGETWRTHSYSQHYILWFYSARRKKQQGASRLGIPLGRTVWSRPVHTKFESRLRLGQNEFQTKYDLREEGWCHRRR